MDMATNHIDGPWPFRWVRGLISEKPEQVVAEMAALLGDAPETSRGLERLCFDACQSLLDGELDEADGQIIGYLAPQLLDAAAAARHLMTRGYVRASLSQVRTMIEAYVVIEFVHGNQERAHEWSAAETTSQRRKFSFRAVYKESSEPAMWESLWDLCSDHLHTNKDAFPVQSRSRLILGGDTWVGPFYDPAIVNLFMIHQAIVQWFAHLITDWYEAKPQFPSNFEERYNALAFNISAESEAMKRRSKIEIARLKALPGTVPLLEQARALATMLAAKQRTFK